jgi:SNF2 family DNA or RNA helicase
MALMSVVLRPTSEGRQVIRDYEFYYDSVGKGGVAVSQEDNRVLKFDMLLTTYETALKDMSKLSKIHWKVLVVDEAHRLKNPESRLFKELINLPRDHCLLLTGTPLQNKTEDLWALLHFADSGGNNIQDKKSFLAEFGNLQDAEQVRKFHTALRPYILRRVKEDVEKSLPPKEETIVEVALTPMQKKFYKAIFERNTQFLFKSAKASNAPSLMNVMMELRKCCNHAYLNRGVEERIASEIPVEQRSVDVMHKQLVNLSGKFVLLDKLLPRLKEEGHKVLIFSQMVKVLDLLEEYLRYVGHLYERLDGNKRSVERTQAVMRFNAPQYNRFIMLLSTRAGGLGLNLTAADTVIIFDSDWNPHNDLQAQARAHRIGQTKAVMVYRLITRKTYETQMFNAASKKLGLDRAVLAHARVDGLQLNEGEDEGSLGNLHKPSKAGAPNLDVKEIDHLLKKGAYDVFRDQEEDEQDEDGYFFEANIDEILERSARKVVYGKPTDGATEVASLNSGFAMASFVSVDKQQTVNLDDPEFWSKAIGLQAPPTEPDVDKRIIDEKRTRKRSNKFYDPMADDGELLRSRSQGECRR